MEPYRIVLADDHAMFRAGLKRILMERGGLEIIGEAEDGLEVLALLSKTPPDLVILDISMPNLRGIEAVHEIRGREPEVKILMLTMHKDVDFLSQAISAGANGYLLKEDAEAEVFSAVDAMRAGKTYVSRLLSEGMAANWSQMVRGVLKSSSDDPLTARERQVLKMIAEGRSNKDVGGLLCISVHTVERHRAKIMDKLELKNTAELVKYAIHKGYI
jgi:DNA-binding NarL/FixJ family response regulator